MNRRILTGLLILMGISLLGIVAVQVYWFGNSVNVRNELFDRSVNDAMTRAVRRLQTGSDLAFIDRSDFPDSGSVKIGIPLTPPKVQPFAELEDFNIEMKRDTVRHIVRVVTGHRIPSHKDLVLKAEALAGKLKNSVMVVGTDSIRFSADSLHLAKGKYRFETILNKKMVDLRKLSNQIRVEYTGWATGRSIDENQLRKILREELTDRAIPIDFRFTFHGSEKDSSTIALPGQPVRWYRTNLFPDDIFRKKLELALFFPDRDQFIGRKTARLLALSVVFTLIIFFTFSWSIYLIVRQKKISEMKSDFINNMTHEFKTPIATISIAADSIMNDKVIGEEEKIRFFAGMIRKENMRMNEQVERILQIARFDRKEFEFNFRETDVHQLIREAVNGFMLQAEQRGGRIETSLSADNPVVTTDPVHFSGLVCNLLDNAIKYTPEDPVIRVSTVSQPGGILISVEDNGIGMSKAVQHRIFERFYRLPSGNIHNVKGFGLGLSYVKAILDANGGTIRVTSEPGKGSRFDVFIPFKINV